MELTITGLEEVQRRLAKAPRLLATKAFLKPLDRAAGVIAAEVEARTPEGETGLLKESVKTVVELDAQGRGGRAKVGFKTTVSERTNAPQDAIAYWVEYGHRRVSGKGKAKKQLQHVPAHPFMRPAAEASGDRAIQVFAETLSAELPALLEGE